MSTELGKVYLVGAGPGDPGLITLRGFRLLQQADVVYYDYLVDPVVLNHAELYQDRRKCPELVCLGRHGKGRILEQGEINRLIVASALAGKVVVRLKGGDPAIFGRTAEEVAALRAAKIPFEIVPGVTTALAASSTSGIPLTQRDAASCVAFVTGQESDNKKGDPLDWQRLAQFPGTLVVYMGITTAAQWSAALINAGKSPDTPVAIIRHCSFADESLLTTSLGQLPLSITEHNLRPPAVIVVGEVVGLAEDLQPMLHAEPARPLWGKTILVTRPQHQAGDLIERLNELGATALLQPAIEIASPADWGPVDAAIDRLSEFAWLVFSSANGVRYFLDRLLNGGHDLRSLAPCRLAAIGSATAETLAEYHLQADLLPTEYRAEALAEALAKEAAGKKVLLLRASRGREVLAEMLTAAGAQVSQVVVYESRDVPKPTERALTALRADQVDWITVTSSAIARSLVRLFGEDLRRANLAAISPLTAGVLEEAGFAAAVIATEYTTEGLLQAVLDGEAKRQ